MNRSLYVLGSLALVPFVAIAAMFFSFVSSPDVVGSVLLIAVLIRVAPVLVLLCTLWAGFEIYRALSAEEKKTVHAAVLPAIDLGLHEARKRKDIWGKAARILRHYCRVARRYDSSAIRA